MPEINMAPLSIIHLCPKEIFWTFLIEYYEFTHAIEVTGFVEQTKRV